MKATRKLNLDVIRFKRRPPMAKQDFTVENRGSLVLLRPNTKPAINFLNDKVGQDNGYQPYWPVALLEQSYVADIIKGIRENGLLVR